MPSPPEYLMVTVSSCSISAKSWGSTSASTALLQYEIDTHAIDLAKRCDQASPLLAYQSCLRTICEVGAVAHAVSRLFPHLHAQPAFAWACTFAETSDGLPLFGHHPQYGPRVLFALAYGGNGITYSMFGAGLLRAQIERRQYPLTALFSFARLRYQ